MELDLELSGLACELFHLIILGECYVDGELLIGVLANDLLLKAGDKLTGADLKLEAVFLAAIECLAVHEALKVDNNGIAVLNCSVLNGNESAVLFLHSLELLFNILIGYSLGRLFNFYTHIVGNFNLGLGDALYLERNAVLLGKSGNVDLGSVNESKLSLVDSAANDLGNHSIYSIIIEAALAVEIFDHLTGSLALSESGNVDLILSL